LASDARIGRGAVAGAAGRHVLHARDTAVSRAHGRGGDRGGGSRGPAGG
jgi:hypothetical protein